MPPKRNASQNDCKTIKTDFTLIAATLSDCNLPKPIILSILTRLPVKSLHRFKCVCRPWLTLISSLNFIKLHRDQTSQNPQNHSLIIHSIDGDNYHKMSLLNINSTENQQPINLLNPFSAPFLQMELVGSLHGLVCLSCLPLCQNIVLWNPALNLCKAIPPSSRNWGENSPLKFSIGFGYDEMTDDFKVVRIACLRPTTGNYTSGPSSQVLRSDAEVYSANSGSWKRVSVDFPFVVGHTRNNVIAKGVPYWTALIPDPSRLRKYCEVLVWFDVRNEMFKHVLIPELERHSGIGVRFVEWKGTLACLVYSPTKERVDFVDVLVYNDDGKKGCCWEKISTHGPIGLKMEGSVQCSKDGVILAETSEGTLFLYDPLTNGVRKFFIAEAQKNSYEAFSHTESLVCLEGMEQVVELDKDKYCSIMEDLGIN